MAFLIRLLALAMIACQVLTMPVNENALFQTGKKLYGHPDLDGDSYVGEPPALKKQKSVGSEPEENSIPFPGRLQRQHALTGIRKIDHPTLKHSKSEGDLLDSHVFDDDNKPYDPLTHIGALPRSKGIRPPKHHPYNPVTHDGPLPKGNE
jgi:hypothetical protein